MSFILPCNEGLLTYFFKKKIITDLYIRHNMSYFRLWCNRFILQYRLTNFDRILHRK